MKTITKLALTFLSLTLLSLNANADSKTVNVSLSFHDALAQSNAEYNQMQKKSIEEENDRSDKWGARDNTAIAISDDNLHADYQDFTQVESGLNVNGRQISAVENQDEEKFEN